MLNIEHCSKAWDEKNRDNKQRLYIDVKKIKY